jgi:hypothetical protein
LRISVLAGCTRRLIPSREFPLACNFHTDERLHTDPRLFSFRAATVRERWPTGYTRRGAHGQDIRKHAGFDEMKADEYRYWQSRPVHERISAVSELTQEQYAMKGAVPDVPRLERTLVRFERAPR